MAPPFDEGVRSYSNPGRCDDPGFELETAGLCTARTKSVPDERVVRSFDAARYHRAQPHRRIADVPIFLGRRVRERLASGPSREPRGGRRGDRLYGSRGGRAARPYLTARFGDLEGRAHRDARARESLRRGPGGVRRAAARARGTQRLGRPAVGSNAGWVEPKDGGWVPVAPSAEKDMPHYPLPQALERSEIAQLVRAFADGARRADAAGFAIAEIHAAHGYLLHEFLTPLANHRTDDYGGSFENRIRFLLETTDAVRAVWPERKPLFVRLSAIDWDENGWTLEESVELARILAAHGVDVIDVTSAGIGRSPL